jgi:hypothetical protein
MLHASFDAHWYALHDTLEKITSEEKSKQQVQERMELVDAETDNTGHLPYDLSEDRFSNDSKELFLTKLIMHEFMLGILAPDANREPSPLFHLHRYSEDMLLALLQCTRDLDSIVHYYVILRDIKLIPDVKDNTMSKHDHTTLRSPAAPAGGESHV